MWLTEEPSWLGFQSWSCPLKKKKISCWRGLFGVAFVPLHLDVSQFAYTVIYQKHPDIWKFLAITSRAAVHKLHYSFCLDTFSKPFWNTRHACLILGWALFSFGKKTTKLFCGMWDFPGYGLELESLASAGGFFGFSFFFFFFFWVYWF